MAHYTERHPNDKATEEFMKGIGFTLHPSCFGCEWHGYGQFFVLKEDVVITSLGNLFDYFRKETYNLAYGRGKSDAIAKLYEKMNDVVFEPSEVNHDKLTIE
jgi:hypothetical protein